MSGTSLQLENPIADAISRVRFSPESNNLLVSSWDSKLRLYDVEGLKLRLEAPAPAKGAILDCCFQSDTVGFTAASDGSIIRYDLHHGNADAIGNHSDLATCIEYSDKTCQVISAGWDKRIICWDTRSAKALECMDTLKMEVESISLSGFHLIVAVGISVHLYDLRNSKKAVYVKDTCMDHQIKCVQSMLDFEGFVVGSIDGRVALEYLYPSNPENKGYVFRCHPKSKDGRHHLEAVNDIVFNPSSCNAFITGDNEGHVIMWDARSKKRLFEWPRYSSSVASLSYSHGGQFLAVASSYTYQEADEVEDPPQIFIHEMDECCSALVSAGSSYRK